MACGRIKSTNNNNKDCVSVFTCSSDRNGESSGISQTDYYEHNNANSEVCEVEAKSNYILSNIELESKKLNEVSVLEVNYYRRIYWGFGNG